MHPLGFVALLLVVLAVFGPAASESAAAPRGILVRSANGPDATFIPWTGEEPVQAEIDRLANGAGGEIIFAPGVYELDTGFVVTRARSLRIAGAGASETRLRLVSTKEPEPEAGKRTIPRGRALAPGPSELSAFVFADCHDVTVEGFGIDGEGVDRRATSGVLVSSDSAATGRAEFAALMVRGCQIHDLSGHGILVQGARNVRLVDNHVHSVGLAAIELFRAEAAIVRGNTVAGAAMGVALNGSRDCRVELNTFRSCGGGALLQPAGRDPEASANDVRFNVFVGCGVTADESVTGSRFVGNAFGDLEEELWITVGIGNEVASNGSLEPRD